VKAILSGVLGLMLVGGLTFAAADCGSSQSSGGKCTPGASVSCVGAGGCPGGQVCASDGSGYGSCACGDGGSSSSGGSSGSGSGGSSGGGTVCGCNYVGASIHDCYNFDSPAAAQSYCSMQNSNYTLEACPTTNVIGTCTQSGGVSQGVTYYSDCTDTICKGGNAQAGCTGSWTGGNFTGPCASGSSSGSSSGGGSCTVPSGTYKLTATAAAGNSANCPKTEPAFSVSYPVPPTGCTETCSGSTLTLVCTEGGVPVTITITATSATSGSGNLTFTASGLTCSYSGPVT